MLQSRDEELRNLRKRNTQLIIFLPIHFNNIPTTNDFLSRTMRSGLDYKLKPNVFDGGVPLREFLS